MWRPFTLVAALCVALLIYVAIVALLVKRASRLIHVTVAAPPARTIPTIGIEDGRVHVLGRSIPLVAVVGTTAVPPVWWFAAVVYDGRVRRTRERRGQCLVCGFALSGKRGRCPCCGERFERSLLPEPLTPVIHHHAHR